MFHHCLIDSKGCSYILHNGANIDGYGRRCGHLTVDNSINELFLTTLWVALLQGYYFYLIGRTAKLLGTLISKEFNGLRLVGLNTNITTGNLGSLHEQFETNENLV